MVWLVFLTSLHVQRYTHTHTYISLGNTSISMVYLKEFVNFELLYAHFLYLNMSIYMCVDIHEYNAGP